MSGNSKHTGFALEKADLFTLWLVPTVEKFPRAQKLLLGDRIQAAALDVLDDLVEATYTRNRAQVLRAVNLKLEKLRLLFRLATDRARTPGGGLDPERVTAAEQTTLPELRTISRPLANSVLTGARANRWHQRRGRLTN